MPRFQDIPQFPHSCYSVNISWDYLEHQIERQQDSREGVALLDLEPDFQRAHVWTEAQQIAYLEYILRGGTSGRDLFFNCSGWMSDWKGPYVIVDGKQRLNAVRQFLANKVRAFGCLYSEYTDKLRMIGPGFVWHVAALKTRAEVLEWYVMFNSGGTVHTPEELERVRELLRKERAK